MGETLGDRVDRLDSRVTSLRWVIRTVCRMLGMDWAEVSRRAASDMEADERKREAETRSKEAPDA